MQFCGLSRNCFCKITRISAAFFGGRSDMRLAMMGGQGAEYRIKMLRWRAFYWYISPLKDGETAYTGCDDKLLRVRKTAFTPGSVWGKDRF
jgi:hypothetical protein